MRKRISIPVIAAGVLLLVASACKPTEKNYRAAYDAALAKRTKAAAELAEYPGLTDETTPRLTAVGADSVYTVHLRLKPVDAGDLNIGQYKVAVASYRMTANCASHVGDLAAKGYTAFMAEGPGGTCYAVAGSFDTLAEAAAFAVDFRRSNPSNPYVGLPGQPVVVEL